ncbi:MAG: metallophosphoesterase [Phycisphaeraceae bacterium]
MYKNQLFIAALWVLITCLCTSVQADEPTAPLTHDNHTHKHNPPHKTDSGDGDRFHTNRKGNALPLPVEEDAFTFAIFGDRTGGPHKGINVLAQAVADVNLIEPDLVMTVGDLINGYADDKVWLPQMKQYKEVMGELICPWFPVAGNHDIYWRGPDKPEGELEPLYEMHFGPLWYAFEHKGCFFIVLYTDEGNPQTGERNFKKPASQRMSDEQFDWLKDILNKAKDADHVFVFLHHPRWLGTRKKMVGYGDDWTKVHKELVNAGNVSGVFAGHIHHMRFDPKDDINYFTLATVGGGQPGWSPKAGWLHHYNLVTVRKDQVAFSAFPVGGVMDPKAITGEVSEQSEVLGRAMPVRFKAPVTIAQDGSVDDTFTLIVKNPAKFTIEIEAVPTSKDSRWTIGPDHEHTTIKPGEEKELTFKVARPAGKFDTTARAIVIELGIDLLTDKHRFPIPVKRITVPGSLRVDVAD